MEDLGARAEPSSGEQVFAQLSRKYQYMLDRSTIYVKARWGAFAGLLFLYCFRVYMLQGWFIITYGLPIYLLNLFIGFLLCCCELCILAVVLCLEVCHLCRVWHVTHRIL